MDYKTVNGAIPSIGEVKDYIKDLAGKLNADLLQSDQADISVLREKVENIEKKLAEAEKNILNLVQVMEEIENTVKGGS